MIKTLGIGDNVCDKYLHQRVIYPGGNALNVAVFSHWMGAEAGYLGTFGDDIVGRHVYQVAGQIGIDLSHCRFEHGDNGCARVLLIHGDRVFLEGNHGGIAREKPPVLTKLDLEYMRRFQLIHTSVYSYMEDQLPLIHQSGAFISMDFSDCLDEDYLKRCCPFIDCGEISCGDMEEDEVKAHMLQMVQAGCGKMVLATRGSKGALLWHQGNFYRQSPNLVEAKDTMGAGDSFIACFLTSYLEGMGDCTDFGQGSGTSGITSAQEYEDMLIRISLYRAAVFSAKQCQRDGSFGFGKKIALTKMDRQIIKNFKNNEGGSVH